jgi:hypothetical protein
MDPKQGLAVIASGVLLCCGVSFSPASSADDGKVSIRYAGSGWDTGIQGFVDKVSLTTTTAQGTFGNSTLTITTEWLPEASVSCPDAYPLKFALVYSASVVTVADQSQLFGISQNGWICASNAGVYFGAVSGSYVGGTGRFKDATGEYVSEFNGAYLEPNVSFRSIRGTVDGTVTLH